MRSAYVCATCTGQFRARKSSDRERKLFESILSILNDVSAASRSHKNVVEYWEQRSEQINFDVFLCHNSDDKEQVRDVARRLELEGIKVWLDEDQLRPGLPWQEILEKQIATIRTAAVFIGDSGMGPWHSRELRAILNEFATRGCPVIPVILPGTREIPELPIFSEGIHLG